MLKHLELINAQGKTLRGYFDLPDCFNGEIVVMFHGFTGNKTEHGNHFRNFSRLLSKNGYASVRMDFSGNGESDGEFSDFTFDTMIGEAQLIIDWAFRQPHTKVSLLGYSMGGAVATVMASLYGNRIDKLLLWSPAGNITDIIKDRFLKGTVLPNGNRLSGTFEISTAMYRSLVKYDPMRDIEKFTNPVLLIHGRLDQSVPYLYSMRYAVRFPNAKIHIVDGAGHGYDGINLRNELYTESLIFYKENTEKTLDLRSLNI